MAFLLVLSILIFIEGGQCFFGLKADDFAKINQRSSDFLPNKIDENTKMSDKLYNFFKKNNVNGEPNEEVSLQDIAYNTTIQGVYGRENVTIIVNTPLYIDVFWEYINTKTYDYVYTLGNLTKNDDTESSITLYNDMKWPSCYIFGPNFIVHLALKSDMLKHSPPTTYTLAFFIDFIKNPQNVSIKDNHLEYDIEQESSYLYGYHYRNTSYYSNYFSETYYASFSNDRETIYMEPFCKLFESDHFRKYHANCTLPDIRVGEQVWVRLKNKDMYHTFEMNRFVFYSEVFYLIPVTRPTSNTEAGGGLALMGSHETKIKRLSPGFGYESLVCVAIGIPIPSAKFLKDGQLVNDTITKSYYGALTVSILPLNGKSMDEAIGNYTCKGSSGEFSKERHVVVEELE